MFKIQNKQIDINQAHRNGADQNIGQKTNPSNRALLLVGITLDSNSAHSCALQIPPS